MLRFTIPNKNIFFSGSIKEILKVVDRTLTRTKSVSEQCWTPLSKHLSNFAISVANVEKITQNIANTVADFHAVGLVIGDFDTSDVYVLAEGEVGTIHYATLSMQ